MLSKVLGLMNYPPITPTQEVGARGAQGLQGVQPTSQNPWAGAVTGGTDVYAQHDRALEHGYAGAHYDNGGIVGRKLNIEI